MNGLHQILARVRWHRKVNLLLLAGVLWLVWGLRPCVDPALAGSYGTDLIDSRGHLVFVPYLTLEPAGTWNGFLNFPAFSPYRDVRETWSFEHGAVVVKEMRFRSSPLFLLPGGMVPLPDSANRIIGRCYANVGLREKSMRLWRFRPIRNAAGELELVEFDDGRFTPLRLRKLNDAELKAWNNPNQ